jgi:hypothetical protein
MTSAGVNAATDTAPTPSIAEPMGRLPLGSTPALAITPEGRFTPVYARRLPSPSQSVLLGGSTSLPPSWVEPSRSALRTHGGEGMEVWPGQAGMRISAGLVANIATVMGAEGSRGGSV